MHRIGEDRTERLDIVPAQLRVIVTIRPEYACRSCTDGVTQARAAAALIESGLPTEGAIAHVLAGKYADHLPLSRQSRILARSGYRHPSQHLGRLGGFRCIPPGPCRRSAGRTSEGVDEAVHGRDHGAGPRSRARPDQDRISVGIGPRRPRLGQRRPAGLLLRPRPQRQECRAVPGWLRRNPADRRLSRLQSPDAPLPQGGDPIRVAHCWATQGAS